jgi:hypothetical protein
LILTGVISDKGTLNERGTSATFTELDLGGEDGIADDITACHAPARDA